MEVTCRSVSHQYGSGVTALRGITLDLRPGVTGLVGVNGAGKSTLLKVLAGGLRPSSGGVVVSERELYSRARRSILPSIALMPQELEVPRDLTVEHVVRYIGWLRGLPRGEAVSRSRKALEDVNLADRASTRVSALSGGMVRRLALAQALVGDPELLLLDEPTTGLDPEQRYAVRELVAKLPPDRITVVSSHVMEDLEQLADHLVVLDHGEVLFQGPLVDLLERQRTATAEQAFLSLLTQHRSSR